MEHTFCKNIEVLKKNQAEISKMKNLICQIENTEDNLNNTPQRRKKKYMKNSISPWNYSNLTKKTKERLIKIIFTICETLPREQS